MYSVLQGPNYPIVRKKGKIIVLIHFPNSFPYIDLSNFMARKAMTNFSRISIELLYSLYFWVRILLLIRI